MKIDMTQLFAEPKIVGVVGSEEDLFVARQHPNSYHILEWRLDKIISDKIAEGLEELRDVGRQIIITVRDPNEGGANPLLGPVQRDKLFRQYAEVGTIFDMEVANIQRFMDTIKFMLEECMGFIASMHQLQRCLTDEEIVVAARMAHEAGADILKAASLAKTETECDGQFRAMNSVREQYRMPVSYMALDKMAESSRHRALREGMALGYGWLAKPAIVGQPSAASLMRHLKSLQPKQG